MPADMIGREISVDDYVVCFNNIYQVKELFKTQNNGYGVIRVMLVDKSPTTKSKKVFSYDVCILPKDDILVWKLKKES